MVGTCSTFIGLVLFFFLTPFLFFVLCGNVVNLFCFQAAEEAKVLKEAAAKKAAEDAKAKVKRFLIGWLKLRPGGRGGLGFLLLF